MNAAQVSPIVIRHLARDGFVIVPRSSVADGHVSTAITEADAGSGWAGSSNLVKATVAVTGVSAEALLARTRLVEMAYARQIGMAAGRKLGMSFGQIAVAFDYRDHKTVFEACRRIEEICDGQNGSEARQLIDRVVSKVHELRAEFAASLT